MTETTTTEQAAPAQEITLNWSARMRYNRTFKTGLDLIRFFGLDMEDEYLDKTDWTQQEAIDAVHALLDSRDWKVSDRLMEQSDDQNWYDGEVDEDEVEASLYTPKAPS